MTEFGCFWVDSTERNWYWMGVFLNWKDYNRSSSISGEYRLVWTCSISVTMSFKFVTTDRNYLTWS